MNTFTLTCHPATLWKVRVVVHRSREAMRRHRAKMPDGRYAECEAFCYQLGRHQRFVQDLIAELHFFGRGEVARNLIVHECAHAAVAWATHCQTDLGHPKGDELFAESLEHLVEGVIHGIQMKPAK